MMNATHCHRYFFHVECYLHQGDDNNEWAFIVIVSFLILTIASTKETIMKAHSSSSSFFFHLGCCLKGEDNHEHNP
jgi:hypothetical protein